MQVNFSQKLPPTHRGESAYLGYHLLAYLIYLESDLQNWTSSLLFSKKSPVIELLINVTSRFVVGIKEIAFSGGVGREA
jgi:hypothetical protein